jgi:tetratricopeptide (TPR) repeat protein
MKMNRLMGRCGILAACFLCSACAARPGIAANPDGGIAAHPDGPVRASAYGAFLAGGYASARDEPALAAQYYRQALRRDPGNPALAAAAYFAALQAGSPDALTLAAQVPDNALTALLRGNEAAMQGDFRAAAVQFQSLPSDDLVGLIKPLLLAWTADGRGDAQAAITALETAGGAQGFGQIDRLNAALIADAAGDKAQAAKLYDGIDASQPDLRLAQIMASWDARNGHEDAAAQQFADLAAAHPALRFALPGLLSQMRQRVVSTPTQGMAEAYLTLAGSLQQPSQGFLKRIFLHFALRLRPDLSAARLLLASEQSQAAVAGGRAAAEPDPAKLRAALATLQPIPAGDPLYAPAALQRTALLAALGRQDAAVALLQSLIAAHPGDPALLATAGDLLRDADKYAAAIGYYDQAIAAAGSGQPGAWRLYFDRGMSEDALGDWAKAEPDLLEARRLGPNQPYVLNYLGYNWAKRGEHMAEAKQMLKQAVGLDPNDGAVLDSLGYVELRLGETRDALHLLTHAVELDPDNAEVNAHLGDAFWQAGLRLQAAYQWQRALAMQPSSNLHAELQQKLAQAAPPA